MPQVLAIQCPQGIQRLIDLGRTVARDRSWDTHPRSREAYLGLWLAVALERAELQGTTEQIDNRVQAAIEEDSLGGDAGVLDEPLRLFMEFSDAAARESGTAYMADRTNITVQLPTETGAWPVAVVVAAVLGAALVSGAGVWQAGSWWRELTARHDARAAVADAAEFALQVSERCRAEKRACTDLELQAVNARTDAARHIAGKMAEQKSGGLFDGLGTTELLLAAAVLGGAYLLTRD